jgi:hypothetical protein
MNNLKLNNITSINNLKKLNLMNIPKNTRKNSISEKLNLNNLKTDNTLIIKKNYSKKLQKIIYLKIMILMNQFYTQNKIIQLLKMNNFIMNF